MEQSSLLFDAPLTADPVSLMLKPVQREESAILVDRLALILAELPDDIELDAPLLALGIPKESLIGWHRSRAMDALVGGVYPQFQAYTVAQLENGGLKIRYRRVPPLMPCPGYGDIPCGRPTVGGKRCAEHLAVEDEDLWDQP